MIASSVDFGWEVMVTIIVLVAVTGFVGLILILRTPRSHRLRVGFFVERDEHEEPEPYAVDDEDTHEWPQQR